MAASACVDDAERRSGTAKREGPDIPGAVPKPKPGLPEHFELPKSFLVEVACRFDGLEEAEFATCYDLHVPALRTQVSDALVTVHVAHLTGSMPAPRPPLFSVLGGPGQSWNGFAGAFSQGEIDALGRDLVLVEQRGTGESRPGTQCTGLDARGILSAADPAAEAAAQLSDCAAALQAQGVLPRGFSVLEMAADIETLRLLLGFEKIALSGSSYGSRIGLEYLRHYGAALDALVIDSILPPNRPALAHGGVGTWGALQSILDACAADSACGTAFPNLSANLLALYNSLANNPVALGEGVSFGPEALSMLLLLGATGQPTLVPNFIETARTTLPLLGFFPDVGPLVVDALAEALEDNVLSLGMYHSVICADNTGLTVADVETQMPALPNNNVRRGVRFALDLSAAICDEWPAPTLPDATLAPVVGNGVPVLVIQGGLDRLTPKAWAETAVESLGDDAQLVVFDRLGHSPVGLIANGETAPCAKQLALDFLTQPGEPVDTGCVASVKPAFSTDFDIFALLSSL